MYIIVVYDVEVERLNKVRRFLRTKLHWVQNSAFEGEVTEAKLERIKKGLEKIIDKERDCIYIYKVADKKMLERDVIGVQKALLDRIY
ncbi:MAG: CRISPR-associated endonuclease Cas2 [bacterium]